MGQQIHDLRELLELLFALEGAPHEPWAAATIQRGLRHPDPEIRELALSVVGSGCSLIWVSLLTECAASENEPWLRRYFALILDDARRRPVAR